MVNFSDLFCNKSLSGSAQRYLAQFRRNFDTLLTSVFVSLTLDGVTSLFQVNNVKNACKRQRYSQNCWRDVFIRWRNVGRIWRIRLLFRRFLCVRIEIDHLLCVIYWMINHSLSDSCKTINHSRYSLVIWSTLQLTSKHWFITQQITARADLLLKQRHIK